MNRIARFNIACSIAFFVPLAIGAELFALSPPPPPGPRTSIFISDLHVGIGRVSQSATTGQWTAGVWHPMEDFRWYSEFDSFLSQIELTYSAKKKPVDLVILGDFLELWQTPTENGDCSYDESGKPLPTAITAEQRSAKMQKNLSCTPADALRRVKRVLGAHTNVMNRLRAFAESGENRLTIVPGNHDAALAFPSVRRATLEAIGASPERVRVATEGYWRSSDGLIFAEHGHFVPGDVNDFRRFPSACTTANDVLVECELEGPDTFLQRPWGEQFVQNYFNQYEERFPIIDNLTDEAYGAKVAVSEAGPVAAAEAIARGFDFLLFHQSGRQFVRLLGQNASSPESSRTLGAGNSSSGWDIARIRASGERFLVDSLDAGDPIRPDAERALANGKLGITLSMLSDEKIKALCNLRAARREAERRKGQSVMTELCPGATTLGALATSLLRSGVERKSDRMEQIRGLVPDGRPNKDFDLYVYAHTHAVHGSCHARSTASRTSITKPDGTLWDPAAINTGAWQRLVSPEGLAKLRAADSARLLKEYVPEDLAACYSTVVVNAYDITKKERPQAAIWFWAESPPKSGKWDFRRSCAADPAILPKDPCAE